MVPIAIFIIYNYNCINILAQQRKDTVTIITKVCAAAILILATVITDYLALLTIIHHYFVFIGLIYFKS